MNNNPVITLADSISFVTNVYETSSGAALQGIDVIRMILLFVLFLTIPIRIYQKYNESEVKGCKPFLKFCLVVTFQLKNVLIIFSLAFIVTAYATYTSGSIDSYAFYTSRYYVDFYALASRQRDVRGLELLSTYLMCLYSLKYAQFVDALQITFTAFKKSSFEYISLLATICVLFLGLSILTNFVFGSYIFEYKSFVESVSMNIKLFIFIEDTVVTAQFLQYYRIFSIIVLIIFIFLIRYYFLNLFYPIFIEYYRIEVDSREFAKKMEKDGGLQDQEGLTFKESKNTKFYLKFFL